jgi:hypothetical protein
MAGGATGEQLNGITQSVTKTKAPIGNAMDTITFIDGSLMRIKPGADGPLAPGFAAC